MGTIISCLELATPMILLPRRGSLRETRNDHQLATAEHFADKAGIWVADTEREVADLLDRRAEIIASTPQAPATSPSLIEEIQRFVDA